MKTPFLFSALKAALIGLLLVTASCKHDTDVVTPDGSTSGSSLAFVGKNLRMTALALEPAQDLDGDGKIDNDLLQFLPDCARDNTIRFDKDGRLSGDEGKQVCPSTGDEEGPTSVEPSTWSYNAQTHILRIVNNGDATNVTEWEVVEQSASGLKAKIRMTSDEGATLKMVMTWKTA
ncbi:hypothetical protein HNV11_13515 [Spirosoma taeanense]|uniref:Lipocalin-like domain-containing protein n=1 Tax=Spirosoma taeanense TaxID=2735870 RepID=A0A6M5YAL3_9BACT|nr:hypothetical protein [Spirosoma taeanense]QJW90320.1 hypothetical protein HNV11_13515 [Spirosoma taeanense]